MACKELLKDKEIEWPIPQSVEGREDYSEYLAEAISQHAKQIDRALKRLNIPKWVSMIGFVHTGGNRTNRDGSLR